jgi:hypothetical protein
MEEKSKSYEHPFGSKVSEETRQHFRTAREEFWKSMEGVVPPDFREHGRNARREMLLAWRSMIDATIARMDDKKKP